jgi:TolA-binding protein
MNRNNRKIVIQFCQLVGAFLVMGVGIMLFLDVFRIDDAMLYISDERVQISENKDKIRKLEENIRDLESDLQALKEHSQQEKQTLLDAIDAQTELIAHLRQENKKLKGPIRTLLDKILGAAVAIMGAMTAYMILKLKRIELKQKEKPEDERKIIVP